MARFQNLTVNRLTATTFSNLAERSTSQYGIVAAGIIPGDNAAATFSDTMDDRVWTSDIPIVVGGSVNAAPAYPLTAGFVTYANQITGTTSGNTATTDRLNVMAVRKGVGKYGVVAAGTATSAGGTTATATNSAVLSTDLVFYTQRSTGTGSRLFIKAAPTDGTVVMTASGTCTGAHSVDYVVVRPLGGFTPSHTLWKAGIVSLAADGAGATDSITIADLKATDVVMLTSVTNTSSGYILRAVPAAGTVAITFSQAPGATTIAYAAFRAV